MLKKVAVVCLGVLLLFLSTNSSVYAAEQTQTSVYNEVAKLGPPSQYTNGIISNFLSDISLAQNGTAQITEHITVYFPTQRHGIYRWIPNKVLLDTGKVLKQPIHLQKVSYQKLSQENSAANSPESKYTTSTSSGDYLVIKIGDADTLISGAYEYTITYSMSRAIRYQDGFQELYLNITGDKWEIPILKAEATLHNTTGITGTVCYTGTSGSKESKCVMNTVANTLKIQSNLPPNQLAEELTIGVKYTDNTFLPPSKTELLLEQLIQILPYFALVFPLFVFVKSYATWAKNGRDLVLSAIPPQFVPTKEMKQESLTILSSLLAMRPQPVATLAELIKLAEKGYLTIDYRDRKVTLKLTPEQQEKLPEYLVSQKPSLLEVVKTLTNNFSDTTTINDIKNVYTDLQKANRLASSEFKESPYTTDTSENLQGRFYIFGGICAIGAFVLLTVLSNLYSQFPQYILLPISIGIAAALYFVFGFIMLKRSPEGNNMALDLLGLKKYIKTAEVKRLEFFNNPKKMIAHFEEILPYSVILGLDKQWAKEFGPILEQLQYQPTWMTSNVPIYNALPRTYAAMSSTMSTSMASISTPPNSGSSSFGGGGGFSGGGSGGGGGGSW